MNLAKAAVASEADCIAKGKPRAAFCLVAHSPPGGTTVHTWGGSHVRQFALLRSWHMGGVSVHAGPMQTVSKGDPA